MPTVTNERGGTQSVLDARFDLVPPDSFEVLASVLKKGAEKYGISNWKRIDVKDHVNHAIAHLYRWLAEPHDSPGECEDHITNAACRCLFAKQLLLESMGTAPPRQVLAEPPQPTSISDWGGYGFSKPAAVLENAGTPAAGPNPAEPFYSGFTYATAKGKPLPQLPLRFYVAGPYSGSPLAIMENVMRAEAIGHKLLIKGHQVFVPHTMTMGWERTLPYELILKNDLDILENWASAFFLVGHSPGADLELAKAFQLGLPIYEHLPLVPTVGARSA